MTIYVDKLVDYGKKGIWCHMAIDHDADLEDLHRFAKRMGMRQEWFQPHDAVPHYDLSPSKRVIAIRNGAKQVLSMEMLRKCSRRPSFRAKLD